LILTINEGLTLVTISKRVSFVQGNECDAQNMAKLAPGLQELALDEVTKIIIGILNNRASYNANSPMLQNTRNRKSRRQVNITA